MSAIRIPPPPLDLSDNNDLPFEENLPLSASHRLEKSKIRIPLPEELKKEKKVHLTPEQKKENNRKAKESSSRLYDDAKKREEKIKQKGEKIYQEECSFKPTISAKSKKVTRQHDVATDLYLKGLEKDKKLKERQEQAKKEYSFHPQINNNYKDTRYAKKPVVERIYEKANEESMKKKEKEKKIDGEMYKECTFSPTILSKSKEMTKKDEGEVHERLYERAKNSAEKKKQLEEEKIQSEQQSHHVSKTAVVSSQKLYKDAEKRKQKQRKLKEILDEREMEGVTFKPQTNKNSSKLRTDTLNVWDRLTTSARTTTPGLTVEEPTFKPQINEKSKSIIRNIDDLYNNNNNNNNHKSKSIPPNYVKTDLSASSPSHLGNKNQPKSPSSLSKMYKSNIPHQVGLSHAVSIPDTTIAASTTSDDEDEEDDNQDTKPLVQPTVDYSSNNISRSSSDSSKSSYSLSRSGSVSSSYSRSQTPTPTTEIEI